MRLLDAPDIRRRDRRAGNPPHLGICSSISETARRYICYLVEVPTNGRGITNPSYAKLCVHTGGPVVVPTTAFWKLFISGNASIQGLCKRFSHETCEAGGAIGRGGW